MKTIKTTQTTTGKYTGIYVRRSVSDKNKDNNSLSIDSQKAECINSLKEGEQYKLYCDDGKSAKDIEHRPEFQRMMSDAKDGLLSSIIVKKYDRFSRNLKDYLIVTDTLDSYGVGVFSLTESFNTTTKEGRVMRNMILSFAEFERETIAERVTDAYNTRALETGFFQGGKVHFGYKSQRQTVNGKTGSVLVPSEFAEVIKTAYEMYKQPTASLQGIIDYFKTNGIDVHHTEKANLTKGNLSRFLESTLYVRADKNVYQYLVSKGYELIDDVEVYDGIHGLFKHRKADGTEYIKVGYHEGIVDSETWLTVQDRKSRNKRVPNNGSKFKNSWLIGLVKCNHCGQALNIYYNRNRAKTKMWRYYVDSGVDKSRGCAGERFTLKTKPDEVEQKVFEAMKSRLDSLVIAKSAKSNPNAETQAAEIEIIRIDTEIGELMEKLAKADEVLFELIQKRVKSLYAKKSELEEKIRTKARKCKEIDTTPLTNPMSRWDELTLQEKHALAVTMIEIIHVSDESGIGIKFNV